MKRLDAALVEWGLVASRSKAQELIAAGEVEVRVAGQWKRITQASYKSQELTADAIRFNTETPLLKYVSRGGLKLAGALDLLGLDVRGWRALDVGISTGGFTDCLLQRGCREIVGLDVGHGQLAESLRGDPRLQLFEGINVRHLAEHAAVTALLRPGVDLCVVDVSFISLQLVLPALAQVLPRATRLLALVKPQFEVGAANLDKSGVVRDETLFADVQAQVLHALEKCGFSKEAAAAHYFPSALKGQDGNQEFFVYTSRV
jgi:23S rRNA (cytidine1920-2'-O)/16S rRNA (cytidine1409-2'-O)-methyltransferase